MQKTNRYYEVNARKSHVRFMKPLKQRPPDVILIRVRLRLERLGQRTKGIYIYIYIYIYITSNISDILI